MIFVNVRNKKIVIIPEGMEPIEATHEYRLQVGKWILEIKADDYEDEVYNFVFDLSDVINTISTPETDFKETFAMIYKKLFIFQKKFEDVYNNYKHIQIGVYIRSIN
jgi:hypothetical protein